MPVPALAIACLMATQLPAPITPRFRREAPLPSVSSVMIDEFGTGGGLANETAKQHLLQARILWIDATANIDRYNTIQKIDSLVAQIKKSGFNTVVFDVKPISGQTVYKSAYAPKLKEWRGQTLPEDFDPLPEMVRACHARSLSLLASLNAFSEGHRLFKVGPGYETPQRQSVLYIPVPILRAGSATIKISPTRNKLMPQQISILTSVARVPTATGGMAVTLNSLGRVDGVYSILGRAPSFTLKANDTLLYGEGEAANFLRTHLGPGVRAIFDTQASYLPIGEQDGGQYPLMMDLNDPNVRLQAILIVRELLQKYDIDGIVYDDRLRYSGLNGDFSPISRSKFEAYVGHRLTWPDDVFKFTVTPTLAQGVRPGPYYDAWIAWRAEQIKSFVASVRHEVRSVKATAQMGVYVGSWYGDYPALGHNYASPSASAGFWFSTPTYQAAGTAPLMDFLIAGCYYPTGTIYQAMSRNVPIGETVEAAGALVNRMVRDETWTYAGIDLSQFKDDPDGLADTLQAACASTQGVMIFDLSHDIEPAWATLQRAFAQPRLAPHQSPQTLVELRRRRQTMDAYHQPERPIIIAAGSSGIGQ